MTCVCVQSSQGGRGKGPGIVKTCSFHVLIKGGKRYFVTFIDNYTRFCYVYLLNSKDSTFNKDQLEYIENQHERKNKLLMSNQSGEFFFSKEFYEICEKHVTISYHIYRFRLCFACVTFTFLD